MRFSRHLFVAVAGAAFLLGPATAAWAQEASVSIEDLFFDPATIEVEVGTTVTWTNNGEVDHTATAEDDTFDSGIMEPGATYSFTFEQEGEYDYLCEVHPDMRGTVTVAAADDNGGGGNNGDDDTDDPTDPGATDTEDETLPQTGAEVGALVYLALALIGSGALFVLLARLT